MLMTKALAYALVIFLSANIVNAAAVYGTVYDLSLKKLNNAGVEINTSPKQFLIAQNGSYMFNTPNGAYTIKAMLMQKNAVIAFAQENITIKQDGSYVIDMILFPEIEEGVEPVDLDLNGSVIETGKNNGLLIGLVLAVTLVSAGLYYGYKKFYKAKKNESEVKIEEAKKEEKYEDDFNDLGQVLKIIKNEGGRATQKDIRKQIPLSEAKVSLMIAELEHKGFIEKIKKGRGNIIILKKKQLAAEK